MFSFTTVIGTITGTSIGTNGAIILPEFNKFAVQFGAFGIRWYALAYLVGLLGGWLLLRREAKDPQSPLTIETVDTLLNYVLFGIIIGGRLGYIIFYNSAYYLAHPAAILRIWEGGMAFHGALLGIAIAVLIMARRHQLRFFSLTDRVCFVVPIGLFFGRLSNFINGELYGRVTTVPWAMIFPNSDGQPRHPSQLYEAGLEGLLLGIIMLILWRRGWLRQDGRLTCVSVGTALLQISIKSSNQSMGPSRISTETLATERWECGVASWLRSFLACSDNSSEHGHVEL